VVDGPTEPDFTIGDILSEFSSRVGEPPKQPIDVDPNDCYTTEELSLMWEINEKRVREILRGLREEGLLIETNKYVRPLGRKRANWPVPAYQVLKNGEDKDGRED
jgi:hypothetical protein